MPLLNDTSLRRTRRLHPNFRPAVYWGDGVILFLAEPTPSREQAALVFERQALAAGDTLAPHCRLADELDGATTTRKPILSFQLSGLL